MDFIDELKRSKRDNDAIWVIVDRITKNVHFIPIKSNRTPASLAQIYVKEVVQVHRVPISIISDRDPLFTSEFWRSLQTSLETTLNLSTVYLP